MKTFLQSNRHSRHWEDCYPLGNGNIGIMDHGNPHKNSIWINDDTFWSGYGKNKNVDGGNAVLEARAALAADDFAKAERAVCKNMLAEYTEGYLPVGRLICSSVTKAVSGYLRTLDIDEAVLYSSYKKGFATIKEESFVSHPAGCYVKKITADKPQLMRLEFKSPLRYTANAEGDSIYAEVLAPSNVVPNYQPSKNPVVYDNEHPGMTASLAVRIVTDGTVSACGSRLLIRGYKSLTLFCATSTSYAAEAPQTAVKSAVDSAVSKTYETLKKEHIEDYTSLYGRVTFDLNSAKESPLSTLKALKEAAKDRLDDSLIVTLFNFGRYLTIASSREGTTASNLQGIWNRYVRPPWSSNYTLNINTQMNYWAAEVCNLSECHKPLLELTKKLASNGKETAARTFKMSGWTVGHNSDLWGQTSPVGKTAFGSPASYCFFVGAAAWLAYDMYEHYLFTMDKDYLQNEALPVIEDAIRFYLDYLSVDNKSGKLVASPGISPENLFFAGRSERYAFNKASTIDIAAIRTLFNAYISACGTLNIKTDLKTKAETAVGELYPYIINSKGCLQEWYDDYKETQIAHRHLSMLYGLYPACEINMNDTPALIEAAKASLNRRKDEGTGWSMAWKACLWARIGDGDRAYSIIKRQLTPSIGAARNTKGGSYPSLLCAHPPFQIDGNFGVTAAIAEMLMQSTDKEVTPLPAIPKHWGSGRITGLKARGNKTVSISWIAGKITEFTVTEA